MDKILFLSGTTRGGALEGIGRAFAPILREMEIELIEISLLKLDPLLPLLQGPDVSKIRFVMSCAGMGMDLSVQHNGQPVNIWKDLGIPFITLFGDSPAYFFDRHRVPGRQFIAIYGFTEHGELRKRLPGINGPIGTVPPVPLDRIALADVDLQTKRDGTLLFLKNGRDPAEIRRMWSFGIAPQVRHALCELADELELNLDSVSGNRIDDAVTHYFALHEFDVEQMINLRLFFIAQLDDYIRAVKCTRMAEWLMDFPVHIRGNNWGHLDFTGKKATYIDDCNYVDSIQLIRESLGTLDMSPNTASLPHDRVVRAYGSHTLCLTNAGQSFTKLLPHQDDLAFSFTKESLQSKVAGLLGNKYAAIDRGIEIAEAFRKAYPPTQTFETLLDYAAFARLDQTRAPLPGYQDFFVWPPQRSA